MSTNALRIFAVVWVCLLGVPPASLEAVTSETGSVRGCLLSPRGVPLGGFLIVLRSRSAPDGRPHEWRAITDDEGCFAFADIPPGKYLLEAGDSPPCIMAITPERISVRAGEVTEQDLHRTGFFWVGHRNTVRRPHAFFSYKDINLDGKVDFHWERRGKHHRYEFDVDGDCRYDLTWGSRVVKRRTFRHHREELWELLEAVDAAQEAVLAQDPAARDFTELDRLVDRFSRWWRDNGYARSPIAEEV